MCRMVEDQKRATAKALMEQRQAGVKVTADHGRAASDPIHDQRACVPAASRLLKCFTASAVEAGARRLEVHDYNYNASSDLSIATSAKCSMECSRGSTGLLPFTATPAALAPICNTGYSTCIANPNTAYNLLDGKPHLSEWSPDCTLSIMVCRALCPVNEDILHPFLAPYGVKQLVVNPRATTAMGSQYVTAVVELNSSDAAARAQVALHGKCLFDGCCYLRIKFASPYELALSGTSSSTAPSCIPSSVVCTRDLHELAAATTTATAPLKILQAMAMSTSAVPSVLAATSTCAPAVVLLDSIPDSAPAATATGETALTSVTPSCCIGVVGLTTPSPTMNSPGGPSRDATESRSAPAPAAAVLPATVATDGNLNGQAISGIALTPATCSTECSGSRVGAPPNVCPSTHATASCLLPVQVWMSPSTFPIISACGNALDATDASAEEVFLDSKDMCPTTPRSFEVSNFQLLKLFHDYRFYAFVQWPSSFGMCASLVVEFLEHDNPSQCKEENKLAKLEQKWMLWSSGDILLLVPVVVRTTSNKFHGTLMLEGLIREGALSFQYFGKLHEKQANSEFQSESFPWYIAWLLVMFPCDCSEFSGSGNLTTMKLMFGSEFAACCLKGKSFRESIKSCGGDTMLNSGNRSDQPLLPIVRSEAYFEKRSTVLPPFSPRKMQIGMNCCQGKFAWDPGRWALSKSSGGITTKFGVDRDYSISYTCYFNNLSDDDVYYYDAFLTCISCYLINLFNLIQVTLGNGYLGENNSDQERQVQWDPGGFAWRRLGVKPKLKEGGLSATSSMLPLGWTVGCNYRAWACPEATTGSHYKYPRGLSRTKGGLD